MKFFFDNTLSPLLAKALGILLEAEGHQVTHLRAKFAEETPDTEWIRDLAQEGGWIIVSGDPHITRGRAERTAWRESHLIAFFLARGWTNLPLLQQASKLIAVWPEIAAHAARATKGSGFLVPVRGRKFEHLS